MVAFEKMKGNLATSILHIFLDTSSLLPALMKRRLTGKEWSVMMAKAPSRKKALANRRKTNLGIAEDRLRNAAPGTEMRVGDCICVKNPDGSVSVKKQIEM